MCVSLRPYVRTYTVAQSNTRGCVAVDTQTTICSLDLLMSVIAGRVGEYVNWVGHSVSLTHHPTWRTSTAVAAAAQQQQPIVMRWGERCFIACTEQRLARDTPCLLWPPIDVAIVHCDVRWRMRDAFPVTILMIIILQKYMSFKTLRSAIYLRRNSQMSLVLQRSMLISKHVFYNVTSLLIKRPTHCHSNAILECWRLKVSLYSGSLQALLRWRTYFDFVRKLVR